MTSQDYITSHIAPMRVPLAGSRGGFALVDAEDFGWLSEHRWYLSAKGYVFRKKSNGLTVSMHREILGLTRGDGKVTDHINRDPLDNRRCNLRECPNGQRDNLQNREGFKGRSGYRGVAPMPSGKWRAYGHVDSRQHHLGVFSDVQEAAAVASRFRAEHMPFSADARLARGSHV